MKQLNTVIIGLGHIGRRHAKIQQSHAGYNLVATCDISNNTIDQIPYFSDLNTCLESVEEIDLVSVCAPNHLHAPLTVSILEQGMHVLCEKPMALTKKDAEWMLNTSLQTSGKLFCMMQNRYSPISQWLKSVMVPEILGEIYQVHVTGFWNRDNRYYQPGGWRGTQDMDGGTLFTQFAHYVDALYWLVGDLEITGSQFRNYNHQDTIEFEDSGSVQFAFGERGIGSLQYSTSVWDRNFESSMTILAEKGTVKVGGQYMDKVVYCHIDDYEMPHLHSQYNEDNMRMVYDNIHSVLTEGNFATATNALDGMKVVDIIERMYQGR